uniref:Uncharacterized protein n=1 Tax=Caenorhabditis tropicalis TaxID=1561998 RepID=A0A1I7USG9_9PELO
MIWVWVKLLKDLLVSLLTWNYGKEVGKHSNLALSTAEHVAKAAVKRMAAPEDTKMTAEDLLPPWVAGESPTKYIKYSEVHANAYETLTVVHPIYFLSQRRCARFRDVDEYEISMRISTIERDLNRHTPDIQNLMDLIMYFKAKFINLVSGYPRIQREIMAFIQKSDIRMKIREDCAQIELVLNYFGNLCQRTSSPNTFSRFQTAFNTGSIFDKMK